MINNKVGYAINSEIEMDILAAYFKLIVKKRYRCTSRSRDANLHEFWHEWEADQLCDVILMGSSAGRVVEKEKTG